MQAEYDVIVVGSGFGGAVSACRLAEKGNKVLVLERGKRWKPEDYPREPGDDWIWDNAEANKQHGWIDIRHFGDMSVAAGAGVGGGSLIYANVSIEAEDWVFKQPGWPAQISYDELKPYYNIVGKMLDVHKIPDNQMPERFYVMKDGATAIGHADRHYPVDLAVTFDSGWTYDRDDPFNNKHSQQFKNAFGATQGTCVHCGNCDIGCQVRAKNTLDVNYLYKAENQHDVDIRPLHQVLYIEEKESGYVVHYDRYENEQATRGAYSANKVILSAGSLGSTEILLRSRDQYKTLTRLSNKLGLGWSANGDFVTPAIHSERVVSPTQGPTISSAINLLDGCYKNKKLFIEDGGIPDVIGNYLEEVLKPPWFNILHWRKKRLFRRMAKSIRNGDPFDNTMIWFGQAIDSPDGHIYLGRKWYAPWERVLKMKWPYRNSESVINAMAELHRELSEKTGAAPLAPPTWKWFRNLITPHPLGGCRIAESKEQGVVNHLCEVFDYKGLYVIDGAMIPTPLGLNPSRTIAAMAERAIDKME